MNKKTVILFTIILWICSVAMVCFCYSTDGIKSGISTHKDLVEKIGEENIFYYSDVFVYQNHAGNYVVGKLNTRTTWEVTEVQVVGTSGIVATPLHFAMIRQGMTPAQVTALVGMPARRLPTGLTYIGYTATNGREYTLCWTTNSAKGTVTNTSAIVSDTAGLSRCMNIKAFIFNHISAVFLLGAIAMTVAIFAKPDNMSSASARQPRNPIDP